MTNTKKMFLGLGGVSTTAAAIATPIALTSKSNSDSNEESQKDKDSKSISDFETKVAAMKVDSKFQIKVVSEEGLRVNILRKLKLEPTYPENPDNVQVSIKEKATLDGGFGSAEVIVFTLVFSKGSGVVKELEGFEVKKMTDEGLVDSILEKIVDDTIRFQVADKVNTIVEFQKSFKLRLKLDNPSLTNDDIDKITFAPTTLKEGVSKRIQLTITSNSVVKQKNIDVFKPTNDEVELNKARAIITREKIKVTNLFIASSIDTSTEAALKQALMTQLAIENPNLLDDDKERITFSTKDITLKLGMGTTIALNILVGQQLEVLPMKIFSGASQLDYIANKIKERELIIPSSANMTNDIQILESIKKQLKIQNPTLTERDLTKITDNISTYELNLVNNVNLTIGDSKIVPIKIAKPGIVNTIFNKIVNREITISGNVKISKVSDEMKILKSNFYRQNPLLTISDRENLKFEVINHIAYENGTPRYKVIIKFGNEEKSLVLNIDIEWTQDSRMYNKWFQAYYILQNPKYNTITIAKGVDTSTKTATLKAIKDKMKKVNKNLVAFYNLSSFTALKKGTNTVNIRIQNPFLASNRISPNSTRYNAYIGYTKIKIIKL